MQTPLPYVAPPKGLIRSLQTDVRMLAHERLADTLRWYQMHHAVDDEQMAARMNACPGVVGIRSRKDDDAHAPIAPAKVTRFKDRKTRPQTQTLAQMTAFFGDTLNMPPFLFWTDLDDVMTAFHDARRFRKERTRKDLLALTQGWLLSEFQSPHCTMAFQLTPLDAAPVILVRGRIGLFEQLKTLGPTRTPRIDALLYGYATLTPKNLNLYLRDEQRRQVVITLDVDAGPFEDDSDAAPYLVIRQATIHLPPEFDATLPKLFAQPRTVRSRKHYIRDLTAYDFSGNQRQAQIASFFSFGKAEWDSIQRTPVSDPELQEIRDSLDPALAGLGLLTPAKAQSRKAREDAATNFWLSVHHLRNLIQATANR